MLAGSLIGAALAAAPCKPLESGEFRDYVVDAVSSIERDDIDVTRDILAVLDDRMPCLDHAPERRLLADLRMVQAILAFVDQDDWEGPLSAALRIRPRVERIVGRAHPIYDWEPGEAPSWGPIATRHALYVDGERVQAHPTTRGWYVLQKTDGIDWNTTLLRGGLPSATWLSAPLELPRRVHLDGQLFVASGGMMHTQSAAITRDEEEPAPDELLWQLPDTPGYVKGLYGLHGIGQAWLGRIGLRLDGAYHFGAGTPVRSGALLGMWRRERIRLGVGVGAADVPGYRRRLDGTGVDALGAARPYASLLLGVTGGSRNQSEVDLLLFGRAAAEGRLHSRWVYTFEPDGAGVSWTVGVFSNLWTAGFTATRNAAYEVRTASLESGFTVGGRFLGRL